MSISRLFAQQILFLKWGGAGGPGFLIICRLYHAGLLSPTTDIAKQHEEILVSKLPGAMKKLDSNLDNVSAETSTPSSDAPKEKKGKEGDEK